MGDQILSSALDGTARIWDATTFQLIRTITTRGSPNPSVFSEDGAWVLAGAGGTISRLWESRSGQELVQYSGHLATVRSVAFSPDGTKTLTGSSDRTAVIWQAGTGRLLARLTNHTHVVNSVQFSSDSSKAITASSDGTIRLWDVSNGREIMDLHQGAPVTTLSVSRDGRYLLAGDSGHPTMAYLWDLTNRSVIRTFSDFNSWIDIQSATLSPDRTVVATGHADSRIRLWDTELEPLPACPNTPCWWGRR